MTGRRGPDGLALDHTHAVTRRLGFAVLPLTCVALRYVTLALGWLRLSLELDDLGVAAVAVAGFVVLFQGKLLTSICAARRGFRRDFYRDAPSGPRGAAAVRLSRRRAPVRLRAPPRSRTSRLPRRRPPRDGLARSGTIVRRRRGSGAIRQEPATPGLAGFSIELTERQPGSSLLSPKPTSPSSFANLDELRGRPGSPGRLDRSERAPRPRANSRLSSCASSESPVGRRS